jgi:hypothetical protein
MVVWLGGMLAAGSIMAVVAHSSSSSVVVVAATEQLASESKLRVLHFHRHLWLVHLWWLEELVRLREARLNIASGGLFMKSHLPRAIFLHFLDFVFNNNGLVDHVLEISVVGVEQLELNIIIQSIQEHVLLLLIDVDVFGGVSRQLNE